MIGAVVEQDRVDRSDGGLGAQVGFNIPGGLGGIENLARFFHVADIEREVTVGVLAESADGYFRAISAAPDRQRRVDEVGATPDECALIPKPAKICGKLADVAEDIPDKSGVRGPASQRAGNLTAKLQVTDQRLARNQKLIRLHVPRADDKLAFACQPSDQRLTLRASLQIILDQDRLPVGLERTFESAVFKTLDHAIQKLDQPIAKVLKRLIPFAVPMRVLKT